MYNEFCNFYFKDEVLWILLYNLLSQHFQEKYKGINCFSCTMVPLLELRGSILAGRTYEKSFFPSYIAAVLGNMLPIPFILLFIEKIFAWMKKSKHLHKIPDWLWKRKHFQNPAQIEKYGYLRLIPFCSHSAAGYRCLDRKSYRSIIRYET